MKVIPECGDIDVFGKTPDEVVSLRQRCATFEEKLRAPRWKFVIENVEGPANPEIFLYILQRRTESARCGKKNIKAVTLFTTPKSIAENLNDVHRYQGAISVLFLIFALIALLLASVGLYAMVAHSVSRRTQEIGVCVALGTTVVRILSVVSSQAIISVGCGLAAGLAASAAVNRVLATFVVGAFPFDPIALAGTTVTLVFCCALGCLIPARARRLDRSGQCNSLRVAVREHSTPFSLH